jgi:hypothetical protein
VTGSGVFLVGVVLTVRKAKARGKRLFVDQPNAVLAQLKHDRSHSHEQDAVL